MFLNYCWNYLIGNSMVVLKGGDTESFKGYQNLLFPKCKN